MRLTRQLLWHSELLCKVTAHLSCIWWLLAISERVSVVIVHDFGGSFSTTLLSPSAGSCNCGSDRMSMFNISCQVNKMACLWIAMASNMSLHQARMLLGKIQCHTSQDMQLLLSYCDSWIRCTPQVQSTPGKVQVTGEAYPHHALVCRPTSLLQLDTRSQRFRPAQNATMW